MHLVKKLLGFLLAFTLLFYSSVLILFKVIMNPTTLSQKNSHNRPFPLHRNGMFATLLLDILRGSSLDIKKNIQSQASPLIYSINHVF